MLRERLKSFGFAFKGIATLLRTEPNARIHLAATLLVIAAGFFFGVSPTEWTLLTLAMAGVWAAEAFNTALEQLTNLVSPDFHPLAGKAKDMAAAGVLLMAIGAAAAGLIVFLPYLWPLIFSP